MKPPKPDSDRADKLLMLSAVFFAVRLFSRCGRADPLIDSAAMTREQAAAESAADAKALLAAAEKVSG
jgi:hypothetical protein